jgi:hypothetical protein
MQNIPSLVVSAVSTWDGKALTKGQKQISGFQKGVKNLAKAFGLAFSVTAITQFSKAAVKAFAEDEAAAVRLSKAVENLGLGFEDDRIKGFIARLEQSAAVSDDVLRPAFQSLLQTTGSVTKSQELLRLALDVSAGSGVDAAEVAKDLGLAYLGNTKGLTKYNLGLTKAELSAAGFNKIQNTLNTQFSGQNAARLDTYAGKMAAINVSLDNAKETIGKGLVDSFILLAGDNGIGGATDSIDKFATKTSDAIFGVSTLLDKLNNKFGTFGGRTLSEILYATFGGGFIDAFAKIGNDAKIKPKPFTTPMTVSGSTDQQTKDAKARAKAEADAAKRAKELLAFQRKQALAEKNKLSLSKAAAVFDTNRISIAAALRATYDKETILRLEALQAIEEDNGELALKKIGELAAFQKNADLAKLAGIKEISEATLNALNTQLLAELGAIDKSKMAEGDKELAREEAFKKYNAAIVAAGTLAAKEQYSERVQIQLTEIARLASLSNSVSATKTATLLRESAELSMIDRVAKAQKAADDARLKALQDYINLLSKVGTGSGSSGLTNIGGTNFVTGPVISTTAILDTVAKTAAATAKLAGDISATEFYNSLTPSQKNDLGGYSPTMNYGGSGYPQTYNININAGVIAQQDEFTTIIQDTIQRLNRGGDPLTTAGIL